MYASSNHVIQNNSMSLPNGHTRAHHHSHPPSSHRPLGVPPAKEPVRVCGIPSITVNGDRLFHGDAESSSERAYTPIKVVGDGSFGTVWLVDWHSKLPPDTPLSPMQCNSGARPEWVGKRLVALKRMKKRWEGGWDECRKLKELESLRAIPFHPNIIPLYDFFLLPSTKELYFVFEPMEGNLYQFIKSRKGRPLAGGLVSCIFRQVVSGLHHIHANGYFHRDMKPENLLVTTTGLFDYRNVSPVAQANAPPERDVVVIVKLADFGLARETKSKPPYTEYVSTRWYRAPEVLLRSRDYSNPVDMWALGTIMAELINLKPLFPGQTEIDQVAQICEILGDPSDEYGIDARGAYIGGGKWVKGTKMARAVGYEFPKLKPVPICNLFDRNTPLSIIECISDLLKYDPDVRLTCSQCLQHPYILETTPGNSPDGSQVPLQINTKATRLVKTAPVISTPSMTSVSPRTVPPSHSNSPASVKPAFNGVHHTTFHSSTQAHRKASFPQNDPSSSSKHSDVPELMQVQHDCFARNGKLDFWADGETRMHPGHWDPMDVSPLPPPEASKQNHGQAMDVTLTSPREDLKSLPVNEQPASIANAIAQQSSGGSKLKLGLGFGRMHGRWTLGMFGHGDKTQHNMLPPVDEGNVATSSSPLSLKRPQNANSDAAAEVRTVPEPVIEDAKWKKKEAERVALEAEKARRALVEKRIREQARAVMQKRNQMLKQKHGAELEWASAQPANILGVQKPKSKQRSNVAQPSSSTATIYAAGGRFRGSNDGSAVSDYENFREVEHRTKARRRDLDDDHSMSSSDLQSMGRLSAISFATAESDPVSSRVRHRPGFVSITRMMSNSSLRTSFGDDFSSSARSSKSLSFEHQIMGDFDSRTSMSSYEAARSSISESSSPLAMQSLSLSSPSQQSAILGRQPFITLPHPIPTVPPQHLRVPTPSSPYEYGQYGQIRAHPPSPAIAPHTVINPIFKVPPLSSQSVDGRMMPHGSLPPFSQLETIAEPLQGSS